SALTSSLVYAVLGGITMRRLASFCMVMVLCAPLLHVPNFPAIAAIPTPAPIYCTWAQVVSVIDGDTIDVDIGGSIYRVRYIGINAPEMGQPCYEQSTAENHALVAGQVVCLESDISPTDQYGRLLRYVYVGDLFVNAELVRRGYANVMTIQPNVRYAELFRQLEREARQAGRGCWGPTTTVCNPDVNRDGVVNLFDVVAVACRYGIQAFPGTAEDANLDGRVDLFDIVCVARGVHPEPAPWPTATRTPIAIPTATRTAPPASTVRIAPWCSQFDAPGNDHDNLNEEYVCLENPGSVAVDMSSWHVKDEHGYTYTFPVFTLVAGARVRLHTGCGTNTATDLYWCHSGAIWNNQGDTVFLYDSAWALVDSYTYY
ncbi:MAG: lamin tail domain-containing protein, partial [Candidatus Hadarchaeum sp.]